MSTVSSPVAFVRLTEVPLPGVVELLNESCNRRYMPLAGSDAFTPQKAAEWVAAKDAQWDTHGYGPWAVLYDGVFAGWGGFQREESGPDFGLVLLPRFWGRGLEVTLAALRHGFRDLGLNEVTIALPFTRNPDRVVARLGFVPDGEVGYDGIAFRRYRLTRADWAGDGNPHTSSDAVEL